MTKIYISIDWDYFIPEKPEWDMGHQENHLFLDAVWGTRGHLIDQIKTTPDVADFWSWLNSNINIPKNHRLHVSESHSYVWLDPALHQSDLLILFDQHHDMWLEQPDQKGSVMAHNWVREWLRGKRNRKVVWVKPTWLQDGMFEIPKDIKRATCTTVNNFVIPSVVKNSYIITGVHVCRSGCWTPPWLDVEFKNFVINSNLSVNNLQDGVWDALEPRWDVVKLNDVIEFTKKWQQALKECMKDD